MSRVVVFGAGGRAGLRTVSEAAGRGHDVTAVVRDPAAHPQLGVAAGAGAVRVVRGDVTDAGDVAVGAGAHDAAISAVARLDVPASDFFRAATRALLAGLAEAGVPRLVTVGIGTTLLTAPGLRVMDDPAFPEEAREFSLGHAVELDLLHEHGDAVDWVVLAPPPALLDAEGDRTGAYVLGGSTVPPPAAAFRYADLAVALVDQATRPTRHRELVSVGYGAG